MDRRTFTQLVFSAPIIKGLFANEKLENIDKKDNEYDYRHKFVEDNRWIGCSGVIFYSSFHNVSQPSGTIRWN